MLILRLKTKLFHSNQSGNIILLGAPRVVDPDPVFVVVVWPSVADVLGGKGCGIYLGVKGECSPSNANCNNCCAICGVIGGGGGGVGRLDIFVAVRPLVVDDALGGNCANAPLLYIFSPNDNLTAIEFISEEPNGADVFPPVDAFCAGNRLSCPLCCVGVTSEVNLFTASTNAGCPVAVL
jgi:hypothetical protein